MLQNLPLGLGLPTKTKTKRAATIVTARFNFIDAKLICHQPESITMNIYNFDGVVFF